MKALVKTALRKILRGTGYDIVPLAAKYPVSGGGGGYHFRGPAGATPPMISGG